MNSIIKYFLGYLQITLAGEEVCRFLNICNAKGIDIWNLHNDKELYTMCISVDDFWRLKEIARKTKVRVRVQKKCGYPFFVNKNRHRKAFLIGIIAFFAIIYTLSLFVWDIHFEGLYTYTEDILMEYLEDNNIKHGVLKADIDCTQIEKMIRNDFFDITWVSVSLNGTRLSIHIKENYDYDVVVDSEYEMSDIIATKDGIITSIITRNGTPLVKDGDVVGANDILVSGNVVVTDEYGTIIKETYENADADIKAKTVYDYSDTVYIKTKQKNYTDNSKNSYGIRFADKSIYLLSNRVKYELYDKTVEQYQLKLSDNFYLPIYWWKTTYNEYELIDINLTEDEIITRLNKNLKNFFDELLEKGVQIIENNVTIRKEDNCYIAEGKIVVIEDFGASVSVEELYRIEDENIERNE